MAVQMDLRLGPRSRSLARPHNPNIGILYLPGPGFCDDPSECSTRMAVGQSEISETVATRRALSCSKASCDQTQTPMKKPMSPRRSSDPRLSAWMVVVMFAMVAVPAAITLNAVRSPGKLEIPNSDPTPHGYTWSLLFFVIPIIVIAF